jgi:hypothetical protein
MSTPAAGSARGTRRAPVAQGRLTNLALLVLLALAFATGWIAFELSGQPARAVLLLHGAAGVGIVLLVPWKSLVARRGVRRRRVMRWASMVLALGVAVSIVFGILHSAGRPDFGYLTAIDFHVGAAVCVIPFFVWHLLARPVAVRVTDLSRRSFLRGALLLGAAGIGLAALPAARRAPTGSFAAAFPVATQWMFDSMPEVDTSAWRLEVAGTTWSYHELARFHDRVTATLDCTGGWYSEQLWEGVWLSRLLPSSAGARVSLNVRSSTGYSRRFSLDDAPRLLLATRVAGSPLGAGNGFPARLVVPGRRGFTWVKWVVAIDADDAPWWWEPPFPLQ